MKEEIENIEYIVEGKPEGSNKWCLVSGILFSFDDAINAMNQEKKIDKFLHRCDGRKWEYRVSSRKVSEWKAVE